MKRVGLNLEGWRSNTAAAHWTDPAILALLPQLHLGFGRWPGGTTANYWDWRTGQFAASGLPQEGIVKGQPKVGIPAGMWASICQTAGATNLVQVNLCTEPDGAFVVDAAGVGRQTGDQLQMLESLASVPYVELGNEIYRRADPACSWYANNPAAYVDAAGALTQAIKSSFPQARVGACSLLDIYEHLNPGWRATVEAGLAGVVDAFTYHHYFPVPAAPTPTNSDLLVADALADFRHAYRSTLDSIPAGHTAWLTEWNYDSGGPHAAQMAVSPTHGLVVEALLLAHLAEPTVELTGPHATLGTGIFAAIDTDLKALTSYGQGLARVGWLLEPSGPAPG